MPDILDNLTRVADAPPALNATSDMPAIAPEPTGPDPQPAPPEPVAQPAAPDTPAEPPAEQEPKPRSAVQERFSQMAQQRREAEARAAASDARLEKALAALERATAPPAEPPAAAPQAEPKPTRDAFETPDAYDEALISWSSRSAAKIAAREAQAEWARQQEAAQQAEAQRQSQEAIASTEQKIFNDWNTRRAEAIEKHPDFEEVAETHPDITLAMRDALWSAEDGPEIAYYLGQHRDEAQAIMKLHPVQQIAAIARLGTKLAAPAPTPTPPPPPINPLRGGNNQAGERDIYTNEPSMDDYAATRLTQLRGERKAGVLGRTN